MDRVTAVTDAKDDDRIFWDSAFADPAFFEAVDRGARKCPKTNYTDLVDLIRKVWLASGKVNVADSLYIARMDEEDPGWNEDAAKILKYSRDREAHLRRMQ